MKATRDGFGDELAATTDKNVVVLNADLGKATRASQFSEAHPDRFFELGIAEANMVGVASGLSEYGYRVVISSFASFLTGRYDIIRCSLAYSNRPVLIVGTHAGMAIGKDGVTQMGLEDISLMRSLPNMEILQPATYEEARGMTKYALSNNRLMYMRLGRQPVPEFYNEEYKQENYGLPAIVTAPSTDPSSGIVILSSGCTLAAAKEAADTLDAMLVNISVIKPLNQELMFTLFNMAKLIVTVEDHSIIGGLGSAVAELLASATFAPLLRIGIQDQFVESGAPADLYKKYGLDGPGITSQIRRALHELFQDPGSDMG